MIGKLIPVLLALAGLGAGVGAGLALRPDPKEMAMMENPCGDVHMAMDENKEEEPEEEVDPAEAYDFVRLNNQFVVPIVEESRVQSLVVLSLTVQVDLGQAETVYSVEPKLRDELLQVMFNHANAGGFNGPFTEVERMKILRTAMLETAENILGDIVSDVLVTNIVRQDA